MLVHIMRWTDLDRFTQAYVECALWASTDENGEPLDGLYSFDDLAEQALAQMVEDCRDFQDAQAELLERWAEEGFTYGQAGHDFWLTRNRHGTGFWDRGAECGRALTDAAHPYGDADLYVGDDGYLYHS